MSLDRNYPRYSSHFWRHTMQFCHKPMPVNRISQSVQPNFRGQLHSIEQGPSLPWHAYRGFLEADIDSDTSQKYLHIDSAEIMPSSTERHRQGNEHEPVLGSSADLAHSFPGSVFSLEPASLFEVSRSIPRDVRYRSTISKLLSPHNWLL